LLAKCLEAIHKHTHYPPRQLVIVHHLTEQNQAAIENLTRQYGAKYLRYEGPFHYARMNNAGVRLADGEVLVFLNDDIEPLAPSWLSDFVAQMERPEIGVAGARLLYPSGTLQHAGITLGIGDGCGHVGRARSDCPYWPWLHLTRNVSAVTGACLAIRKQLFEQIDGFDEAFPVNYNDVDLCIRAGRAGYRVIYDAGVVLRHHECQTRRGGVTLQERERWFSRWADLLDAGDPFYNANLSWTGEDASLSNSGGSPLGQRSRQ